jgi:hypothetical protein
MKTALSFTLAVLFGTATFSIYSADGPIKAAPVLTLSDLAIFSEAVVVGRVGALSSEPAKNGGSVALWIERMLKGGRLRANRDIVWVPGNQLPKAEAGQHYLLFLSQLGNGAWTVQTGGSEKNVVRLTDPKDPVLAEVSKAVGSYGPPAGVEAPAEGEVSEWIRKASRGSQEARREAYAKLIAAGDYARAELISECQNGDRDMAVVAQTVLPLITGGPAVNGLRLGLEPGLLEIDSTEPKNLQVNFTNLSKYELRVVTGSAAHGDVVLAASAYEIRPLSAGAKIGKVEGAPLPTVLPVEYGAAIAGSSPLPQVRSVAAMTVSPLTIRIELEGKRLKFPHGFVELPGLGRYAIRVKFACPGPRPDQERLIASNLWGGGQLVSNDIELVVK